MRDMGEMSRQELPQESLQELRARLASLESQFEAASREYGLMRIRQQDAGAPPEEEDPDTVRKVYERKEELVGQITQLKKMIAERSFGDFTNS